MMKNLLGTAAVTALSVGLFSVTAGVNSEDTATEERDVAAFERVTLNGSMDVDVVVGKKRSVTVIADADIIDRIITDVDGGTLTVKLEKGRYRNVRKMLVKVTAPDLEAAKLEGSGDLMVTGVDRDDFNFSLHGSGDAILKDTDVSDLSLSVYGSGDLSASGTCDSVEVALHGSGDLVAKGMKCKDADVALHGSGDLSAYASEKIKISLHGSGDIDVYGKPDKVTSKVRGSGDVDIN